MNKIYYAFIAMPIFIFGPFSLLICTECVYPDSISPYIAFGTGTIFYYLLIILPLNYIFSKTKKNKKL